MSEVGRWADLTPRIASAAVLAAVGLTALWMGGSGFLCFVALACAAIIWELVRMLSPDRPKLALGLGAVTAAVILVAHWLPTVFALWLLLLPAVFGVARLKTQRAVYAGFAVYILFAGFGLVAIRTEIGLAWACWLIATVVVTDIAGYFAGKAFGGPKFWPRISPKKTWSGTAAGWAAAALVGLGFLSVLPGGLWLILLSVAASFAAQMGDIAESAIKRRTGVKDSSHLIPGHGGVFDRFDGMLGAAVLVLLVIQIAGYPAGAV